MAILRPASPNRIRWSRQDSLILLTNLSATAFRSVTEPVASQTGHHVSQHAQELCRKQSSNHS